MNLGINRYLILTVVLLLTFIQIIHSQNLGSYFSKKSYSKTPIPKFEESRDRLPRPVIEGNKKLVDMYWKCWKIAFRGFKAPPEGSPLVSNWLDEAFSGNIFQWDTIFMMMFARYAHRVFPAIQSLDNFYAMQRESGFIGREYREKDGRLIHYDFDGGLFSEKGYKNVINPPLFSWAEVESFNVSGDKSRFEIVLPVLDKYAEWLNREGDPEDLDWENNGRRAKGSAHGLFWNTPLGSGMDNTPRPAEIGAGWVEMSAQMAIMYNNLAVIASEQGKAELAESYRKKAEEINGQINKWCWNEEDGFYYDVTAGGEQFRKKTVGAFWTLLAGTPNKEQARRLVEHLKNPKEFWRKIPFSTLSADEDEYQSDGGYWLGGVWAPTNLMIIKGLKRGGFDQLALKASEKYLLGMLEVFEDSGTVYENYAPDFYAPGNPAKSDFVGWSGIGPIQLLIEEILGFEVIRSKRTLVWNLHRTDKHGIYNLSVGTALVSAVCENRPDELSEAKISVRTDAEIKFVIKINGLVKEFSLSPGKHELSIEND